MVAQVFENKYNISYYGKLRVVLALHTTAYMNIADDRLYLPLKNIQNTPDSEWIWEKKKQHEMAYEVWTNAFIHIKYSAQTWCMLAVLDLCVLQMQSKKIKAIYPCQMKLFCVQRRPFQNEWI